jgi:FKBP-type peptidyl-prolyl cis-trans isomerase FklB
MSILQDRKMERQYGANKIAGEKFLAENAKKPGVITTASGLQYEVIKKGNGPIPSDTSKVKVNYHGTLIDGTVFDSSVDRKEPIVFKANQVIKGWTEALKLMPVGSKYKLYIPQQLAYGNHDQGKIKPFSTLIFEVELISIEK